MKARYWKYSIAAVVAVAVLAVVGIACAAEEPDEPAQPAAARAAAPAAEAAYPSDQAAPEAPSQVQQLPAPGGPRESASAATSRSSASGSRRFDVIGGGSHGRRLDDNDGSSHVHAGEDRAWFLRQGIPTSSPARLMRTSHRCRTKSRRCRRLPSRRVRSCRLTSAFPTGRTYSSFRPATRSASTAEV